MNFRFQEPRFLSWLPFVVIGLLFIVWYSSPDFAEPAHNDRFLAFGTLMDINIVGVNKALSTKAIAQLEKDFEKMHHLWHAWNPGPLGRVNLLLTEGKEFSAPTSVLPLIKTGQELSEKSDHLFNPAIGKLINLWGFQDDNFDSKKPPMDEEIEALVKLNPRMSDIHINDFRLSTNNSAVKLDFGAFGKGVGIDRAIEKLKSMGIENAILNAGGDLRAIGSRDGKPWRIAIKRPSGTGVLGIIETNKDESIFTSGDYERNYTYDDTSYHHILDPRTGYPAKGVLSVTVIHSNATTADAAATALFIAGPKDWHRIAKKMGVKFVLLIDSAGTLHMNPAMQNRIKLLQTDYQVNISAPLTST